MANYYTEFSTTINDLTDEEREWLVLALRSTDDSEEFKERISWLNANVFIGANKYSCWPEFECEFEEGGLWIHSDLGNMDQVADLVLGFLHKFRPSEVMYISWADYCSKPRVNEQGGGAVVITAEETHWMSTWEWAALKIKEIKDE